MRQVVRVGKEMVHTIWLGLCLTHPEDWVPALLGTEADHGRCTLVDRYQERMDVQWRPSRAIPDLDRMFRQYQRAGKGGRQAERLAVPEWTGFVLTQGNQVLSRAGRYFRDDFQLVETAVVWPKTRDKALERRLLGALTPDHPPRDCQRFQALGLSVEVPDSFRLKEYVAQPGHVQYVFNASPGTLTIHRLSEAGDWLRGTLDDWLEHKTSRLRLESQGIQQVQGHPAMRRLTTTRPVGWRWMLGQRLWQEDLAWRCSVCERIYRVTWACPGHDPTPAPPWRVGCCAPLSRPALVP